MGMLSKEDQDVLTQVGPGTKMGNFMRRFWIPAALEREVSEPDCPPVRLRLLGEDLVLFRDSKNRIGILAAYCPHRGADLYLGRNEDCGLRCIYHGWKFDIAGNCLDMPSEPTESNFADKVKIKSYPCRAQGGVIWVFMGPDNKIAQMPRFEWSFLKQDQIAVTKRFQECNWAQAYEGGIDSSHISLLHSNLSDSGEGNFGRARDKFTTYDRHPVFQVANKPYGLAIAARRTASSDSYYWRITQSLFPFYTMIPPVLRGQDTLGEPYGGHAWVPIDDKSTWTWSFGVKPQGPLTQEEYELTAGSDGRWGPIDQNYRPLFNRRNNWGQDRDKQVHTSFSGIDGVANQDAGIQESMGEIVDRTKEHLGASDVGIIEWRKRILTEVKALEKGKEPSGAFDGFAYNVRPASVLLPRNTEWQQGASRLLGGILAEK